jgi:hypothetical protein
MGRPDEQHDRQPAEAQRRPTSVRREREVMAGSSV